MIKSLWSTVVALYDDILWRHPNLLEPMLIRAPWFELQNKSNESATYNKIKIAPEKSIYKTF